MANQLGETVENVKSSNASEEFERKARKILVGSADALKMEFHQRMETLEVLNHVTKLSRAAEQEIKRIHDRQGQVAANRMLIECIFRPDDGIFELLQALISTGQSKLVRELLEKIRSITRNATLIGIIDGAPASANGGGNVSAPPGNSAMEVPVAPGRIYTHPQDDSQLSAPHTIDAALFYQHVQITVQKFGSVENFINMWRQQPPGGT